MPEQSKTIDTSFEMNRVNVIGSSGSGKSFVADAVCRVLGLPLVRLDALRHGTGWTEVPDTLFTARVGDAAVGERWVMDGNYLLVRRLIWERADTVIWTDFPLRTVMAQVVWRSVRDWATRHEPIPGNPERLRDFIQPSHPIRWAWSNHACYRKRDEQWLSDSRWAHLNVIRLTSRTEVHEFIRALERQTSLDSQSSSSR